MPKSLSIAIAVAAGLFLLSIPSFAQRPREGQRPQRPQQEAQVFPENQKRNQVIVSKIMDKEVLYNVLLPKNYDPSKTYPVIYLLHGMFGNNNDWLRNTPLADEMDKAVSEGIMPETIVVMPQGFNLFYVNSDVYATFRNEPSGSDYEDFFFKEFIPHIEKTYSVSNKREGRVMAGLSMGGFGSMYYGLKHPDMFCYVYAMSPAANEPVHVLASEADKDALPFISIATGASDETVKSAPEDFFNHLVSLGIRCEYHCWPGKHDWKFWTECVPVYLQKIGAELKKNF